MSLGFVNQSSINVRNQIRMQSKSDTFDIDLQGMNCAQNTTNDDNNWSVFQIMFLITCLEMTCVSIPLIISAVYTKNPVWLTFMLEDASMLDVKRYHATIFALNNK